jgi:putative transposase
MGKSSPTTKLFRNITPSPPSPSDLNQKMYERIDKLRNRPIEAEYPYVYLDGICLKHSWAGEVRNVSVLVAIGVGTGGAAFCDR